MFLWSTQLIYVGCKICTEQYTFIRGFESGSSMPFQLWKQIHFSNNSNHCDEKLLDIPLIDLMDHFDHFRYARCNENLGIDANKIHQWQSFRPIFLNLNSS